MINTPISSSSFTEDRAALLLLAFLLLLLGGCGGNYVDYSSKTTGKSKYLDPNLAKQKIQGIEKYEIDSRGVLSVKLTERLWAPEYEAPIIQKKQHHGTRANPIGSTITAALTLGLYPLLKPADFIQYTVGKEHYEQVLSEETDKDKATTTGRFEWVSVPLRTAKLKITVAGRSREIDISADEKGDAKIDLAGDVLNNSTPPNLKSADIQITCLSCTNTAKKPDINFPQTVSLPFAIPAAWNLIADYKKSQDLIWISASGLKGDEQKRRFSITSKNITWNDISQLARKKGEDQLRRQTEIPTEIQQEKYSIELYKPTPQISVTRDEFESTAAFAERVRQTRLEQEARVTDYNRRVESLNQRLKNFENNVPRTLTPTQQASVFSESLLEQLGEPDVKNVAYDADLQRFVVSVTGSTQYEKAPISFTLVSATQISPEEAKSLKTKLNQARPFMRFSVNERSLRMVDSHLLVDNQIIAMKLVDAIDLPPLATVNLNANTIKTAAAGLKKIGSTGISEQPLVLANDDESRRLREKLDYLRNEIGQRQQVTAEKERMTAEMRQLEAQLKKIDQGAYDDDLSPKIANVKQNQTSSNVSALVIGISDYSEFPKVIFADRSAMSFAELIRKKYGLQSDNLITMVNADATGTRITSRLKNLLARIGKNDRLIVYYSGHAAPTKDGKNTVLVPQDATAGLIDNSFLRLADVYKMLLGSQAREINVILDTCFAGRADDNAFIYRDVAPLIITPVDSLNPPADPRITVLASGGPNDFANAMRAKGHRLFTYYLLGEMLRTPFIQTKQFDVIRDRVSQDANRLGTDHQQKPLWIGKRDSVFMFDAK
jgi:hypothetical protein